MDSGILMTYRCLTNHTHTLIQHTNIKKEKKEGGLGGYPPHIQEYFIQRTEQKKYPKKIN